jgi:hypothetical protein
MASRRGSAGTDGKVLPGSAGDSLVASGVRHGIVEGSKDESSLLPGSNGWLLAPRNGDYKSCGGADDAARTPRGKTCPATI